MEESFAFSRFPTELLVLQLEVIAITIISLSFACGAFADTFHLPIVIGFRFDCEIVVRARAR